MNFLHESLGVMELNARNFELQDRVAEELDWTSKKS